MEDLEHTIWESPYAPLYALGKVLIALARLKPKDRTILLRQAWVISEGPSERKQIHV
jgi:hypothetical protein